jgi:hypothetical protein
MLPLIPVFGGINVVVLVRCFSWYEAISHFAAYGLNHADTVLFRYSARITNYYLYLCAMLKTTFKSDLVL